MSTISDEEKSTLYRVRKTILEMLVDRKYAVPQAYIKQTQEEFGKFIDDNVLRENLSFVVVHSEDNTKKLSVNFYDHGLKSSEVQAIISSQQTEGINRVICVFKDTVKLTQKQKDLIITTCKEHIAFEIFYEHELIVNITKHVLVPKHIPLTEEEKRALLAKYKVSEAKLPRVSVTDPVARYLGLQRGQVVKIIRKSETAGRYVTYRVVS